MTKEEAIAKIEARFEGVMSEKDKQWLRELHMAQLAYILVKAFPAA